MFRGDIIRIVLLWGAVLAAGAFGLQWLEYQYLAMRFSFEIYVGIIAVAFALGGMWLGWRLASRPRGAFRRNDAAIASLGLTRQEMRALELIAAGQSNKEMARTLGVAPNTVKTHISNLFAKLEVARRTQAVIRARELELIP
ncbi:MAG: response regulator transcription factor [Caulobacteraceae bacterium]|nr:response regulator transcription factor [Caulobacteraceae bacterium]